MYSIDVELFRALNELKDNRIELLIKSLADYVIFISKIEKEMSKLDLDTKSGLYMAGMLDSQRREKHDLAIISLKELNSISNEKFGKLLYNGSFDDEYRNEIAQAIMLLCENLLL